MRIINIVTVKENCVYSVEAHPIHVEELSDEVTQQAEKRFSDILINMGADESEIEDLTEEGFYENHEFAVNLFWSYIN